MTEDGDRMRRISRPVWIVIFTISLIVLLGGTFFLFRYLTEKDRPVTREELSQTVSDSATTPQESTATEPATTKPTEKPINSFGYAMDEYDDWEELNFDRLMQINPDIYAWIYIPDTNVDYPVAQSSNNDDSFYLSHNIYKDYQFSGTIYSEVKNSKEFDDPVTVLYGHNMLNGSMFATLHYFTDPEFFEEHTTCFVLTKDKIYTYLIYSAYIYDDRHILNSFNFTDEDVFRSYLESTLNPRTYNGNVRDGVKLDEKSRILTLSTCTNGVSDTRYLVQGVLVNEQLRK